MASGTTSKYKAIIFDMDGTLTESMYVWRGVFKNFIRKHNLKVPEKLEGIPEYPLGWSADLLLDQLPGRTREDVVLEMLDLVDYHYATDVQVKTDAPELVRRLREKGYKLAIATATQMKYAKTAIKRLGYESMFDVILSTHDLGVGKDKAECFERIAGILGCKTEECVMFEDALHAVKSAKAAGMAVCAIEDYYAWRQRDEIKSTADRYLTCYRELLEEMDA